MRRVAASCGQGSPCDAHLLWAGLLGTRDMIITVMAGLGGVHKCYAAGPAHYFLEGWVEFFGSIGENSWYFQGYWTEGWVEFLTPRGG